MLATAGAVLGAQGGHPCAYCKYASQHVCTLLFLSRQLNAVKPLALAESFGLRAVSWAPSGSLMLLVSKASFRVALVTE